MKRFLSTLMLVLVITLSAHAQVVQMDGGSWFVEENVLLTYPSIHKDIINSARLVFTYHPETDDVIIIVNLSTKTPLVHGAASMLAFWDSTNSKSVPGSRCVCVRPDMPARDETGQYSCMNIYVMESHEGLEELSHALMIDSVLLVLDGLNNTSDMLMFDVTDFERQKIKYAALVLNDKIQELKSQQ